MSETLILFSKSFPYKSEESFLYKELETIHSDFKQILIIPLLPFNKTDISHYKLPSTVHVVNVRDEEDPGVAAVFLFLFSVLPTELFRNFNFKGFLRKLRYNFGYFKKAYSRSLAIEKELKEQKVKTDTTIFYSYWLNENALSLALIKKRNPDLKTIGRGHGYDVFPGQAKDGYNPFQATILKYLDKVVLVSKKGTSFLQQKYPSFAKKMDVAYLGTGDHANINPLDITELRIVSCSHIRGVKGVHRIPKVIADLGVACEWVHLGGFSDQVYKEEVLKEIESAKARNKLLRVELKGTMTQEDIYEYYKDTPVTLLISLSRNEGLPVSMMEAISFGIPVFSTDVGGCNEIAVKNVSGICVEQGMSEMEMANVLKVFISEISSKRYDRKSIKEFWKNNFSANDNYKLFSKKYLH